MSAQNKSPLPQWWKAWVLLAGVGLTAGGALALSRDEAAPVGSSSEPPPVLVVASLPSARAERLTRLAPQRATTALGRVPAMPAKPRFTTPITRTRRS